jgi:hypothetical protein
VDAQVADNAGNTASDAASFKIDETDPSVAISLPADGSSTIAPAIFVSGTVSDATSGVASVEVNGSAALLSGDSFTAGPILLACGANTLTAVAGDSAGNESSDAITVTRVCFSQLKYYAPINQTTPNANPLVVNTGKYGRVIPTKVTFALSDGTAVTEAVALSRGWTVEMGVISASCATGSESDSIESYADAGNSNAGTNRFRWSGDHWIYNLDTKAPPQMIMQIGSCYRLDVWIADATTRLKLSTSTIAIFKPTK